jgi:hypothetical protein
MLVPVCESRTTQRELGRLFGHQGYRSSFPVSISVADVVRSLGQRIFAFSVPWQDWLFIPLLAQWIYVNYGLYPAYPHFIFDLATFQRVHNVIFPYT